MANKPTTTFLGKDIPKHVPFENPEKATRFDFCSLTLNCEVRGNICHKCLFNKVNEKEFKLWQINRRLLS